MRCSQSVLTAICVATLSVLSNVAPAGASEALASWSIKPTPNPSGASVSVLKSVSCTGVQACTAVGYSTMTNVPPATPLVERWNGSSWVIQATPALAGFTNSGFFGVSCPRRQYCVAVGFAMTSSSAVRALAEVWNGHRWRIAPTARPANANWMEFGAVSCTSPNACTAVGGYIVGNRQEQPLAELWNGSAWSLQVMPNPHAENGSDATGVSCTSRTRCTAVGEYVYGDVDQKVFAMQWDGSAWVRVRQPNPQGQIINSETSVSCSGSGTCTAVGSWTDVGALPLAERWDGATWRRQAVPQPSGSAESSLSGVSCPLANSCIAVGDSSANLYGLPSSTLAERWNGSSWAQIATPNPAGALISGLSSVACPVPNRCIAVGDSYQSGVTTTLAEIYAG